MNNLLESRPLAPVADPFRLRHDAAYRQLSGAFYTLLPPEKVAASPVAIHASASAAKLIGLDRTSFSHPSFATIFSGMEPLPGFEPLAMVYSGHQFGQWAGQLGDGRALTIGQVRHDGTLWDIQLKGAGRTPYSRFGDGRAVLRSSIREYLCSEAMAALGVPTTRSLALVATRARVLREAVEPGAVVTRLMRSNIRFGHFEHFHHGGRPAEVRELADFVIGTYHPELAGETERYALWFDEIVTRTAHLMAHWQALGFCHGVMNTDNMSILGDTIDYGPFGFLDAFDPGFICNHSDHAGRYAYDQQPGIGLWNLKALAIALGTLVPWEAASISLKDYPARFMARYGELMRVKIGLRADGGAAEDDLVTDLLGLMRNAAADYSSSFRLLSATADNPGRAAWTALFDDAIRPAAFAWLDRWHVVQAAHDIAATAAAMNAINPRFILRNWVAETAIRAVEDDGDVATLHRIFMLVTNPFTEHDEADQRFAAPPEGAMRELEVSCSS
ncbi:MAG: protein adenylyltransferase SelO [Bosea sp. (in: a-proteobacteria)]